MFPTLTIKEKKSIGKKWPKFADCKKASVFAVVGHFRGRACVSSSNSPAPSLVMLEPHFPVLYLELAFKFKDAYAIQVEAKWNRTSTALYEDQIGSVLKKLFEDGVVKLSNMCLTEMVKYVRFMKKAFRMENPERLVDEMSGELGMVKSDVGIFH
ncbi:hypothetical protein Tco_0519402 [Tanacetum coccineum]